MNGRFENVPRAEQPKVSNRKKDGGRDTALRWRSVNQVFPQNSGHLGGEEANIPGDPPIARMLKCYGREYDSLHQIGSFARGAS